MDPPTPAPISRASLETSARSSVTTARTRRASRQPGFPDGKPGPPGMPRPASSLAGRRPLPAPNHGLLQTLNKLEQESETRAFELINLRTLVLKVEKEREDALAQVRQLKEQNQELHEELARTAAELAEVRQERNAQRIGEWLEGASGLSHVRALAAVAAVTAETAQNQQQQQQQDQETGQQTAEAGQGGGVPAPATTSAGGGVAAGAAASNIVAAVVPTSAAAAADLQTIREDQEEVYGVQTQDSVAVDGGNTQDGPTGNTDGAGRPSTGGLTTAPSKQVSESRHGACGGAGLLDASYSGSLSQLLRSASAAASAPIPTELLEAVVQWEAELESCQRRIATLESDLEASRAAEATARAHAIELADQLVSVQLAPIAAGLAGTSAIQGGASNTGGQGSGGLQARLSPVLQPRASGKAGSTSGGGASGANAGTTAAAGGSSGAMGSAFALAAHSPPPPSPLPALSDHMAQGGAGGSHGGAVSAGGLTRVDSKGRSTSHLTHVESTTRGPAARSVTGGRERTSSMETLMGAGVTPMQGDTNPLNAALSRAASRKDAGASSVKTRAAATTDGGESEELEAVVTALKTKISKLEADRDEQAALRQVEVEHIKYTKDQQAKEKDALIAALTEQLQDVSRRAEDLEAALSALPASHDPRASLSSSVLSPTGASLSAAAAGALGPSGLSNGGGIAGNTGGANSRGRRGSQGGAAGGMGGDTQGVNSGVTPRDQLSRGSSTRPRIATGDGSTMSTGGAIGSPGGVMPTGVMSPTGAGAEAGAGITSGEGHAIIGSPMAAADVLGSRPGSGGFSAVETIAARVAAAAPTSLEIQVSELQALIASRDTEIACLQAVVADKEARLADIQCVVQTHEAQIAAAQARVAAKDAALEAAAAHEAEVAAKLAALQQQLELLAEAAREGQGTSSSSGNDHASVSEAVRQVEEAAAQREAALHAELQAVRAAATTAESALLEAKSQLEVTKSQLEGARSELAASRVELEALKSQLESSTSQLLAANSHLEEHKAELETSKAELHASKSALSAAAAAQAAAEERASAADKAKVAQEEVHTSASASTQEREATLRAQLVAAQASATSAEERAVAAELAAASTKEALSAELAAAAASAAEIQRSLEAAVQERDKAKSAAEEAAKQLQDAQAERDRVLAESTAAGEHLHSKFAELERTLMTARDILQKERDELAAQVASLTQGAEPLHEQLVTLREALTDQAGQLSKAQVAAKEASQELQATKARLSEVEASLKSAQEEVSAVRAEREMAVMSLKAEAATQLAQARTEGAQQLEATLTSHSAALTALREDLDKEWRRRVEEAQAATSAAQAVAAEKEKQVQSLQASLEAAQKEAADASATRDRVAELEQAATASASELASFKEGLSRAEARLQASSAELAGQVAEVQRLKQELQAAGVDLKLKDQEHASLLSSHQALCGAHEELAAQAKAAQGALAARVQELEARLVEAGAAVGAIGSVALAPAADNSSSGGTPTSPSATSKDLTAAATRNQKAAADAAPAGHSTVTVTAAGKAAAAPGATPAAGNAAAPASAHGSGASPTSKPSNSSSAASAPQGTSPGNTPAGSHSTVSTSLVAAELRVALAEREAELAALSARHDKMQGLIKDMAGQMEVLQGQLRVQGSLASKLRAELASVAADSAAAREVADATEAALRLRLEETERKLSEMERKLAGSRVRNMELQKEVSALQQGAGGAHGAAWASWGGGGGAQIAGGHGGAVTPLHGPLSAGAAGRHESQALYRKLRNVAAMYRLNLGTTLFPKQRTDATAGNATDLQLWQTLSAVISALEVAGASAGLAAAVTPTGVGGIPHNPYSKEPTTGHVFQPGSHVSSPASTPGGAQHYGGFHQRPVSGGVLRPYSAREPSHTITLLPASGGSMPVPPTSHTQQGSGGGGDGVSSQATPSPRSAWQAGDSNGTAAFSFTGTAGIADGVAPPDSGGQPLDTSPPSEPTSTDQVQAALQWAVSQQHGAQHPSSSSGGGGGPGGVHSSLGRGPSGRFERAQQRLARISGDGVIPPTISHVSNSGAVAAAAPAHMR